MMGEVLFLAVLVWISAPAHSMGVSCNSTSCMLPDCYCERLWIPKRLAVRDTPQMVTFTYTGPITAETRSHLKDVFPETVMNPNGCPMGITLFVLGKGTDLCEVHQLYVRGHEVAVQGNQSVWPDGWTSQQWRQNVADYKAQVSAGRYVPHEEIKGMRAALQQPGADEQFLMMDQSGFHWDSTLLGGSTSLDEPPWWPVTLTFGVLDEHCHNPGFCPQNQYPDIWEVHLLRLANDPPCTYLDACVSTDAKLTTSAKVYDLLYYNFQKHYNMNRAPFQVNLREESFSDSVQREALKRFITTLVGYEDTWMLTISEMLNWVQNPRSVEESVQFPAWECLERDFMVDCSEYQRKAAERAESSKDPSFGDIIDPRTMVILEYVLLFLAYILVVAYDRYAYPRQRALH